MSKDMPKFRGHFPITNRRTKRWKNFQKWRYPRGIFRNMSSKRGPQPKIGYGHKAEDKHKHPLGMREVLVCSKTDLEKITEKDVLVRFSSTLGKKKKQELYKIVEEKGLKALN